MTTTLDIEHGIARVTLADPENRNALSATLVESLVDHLDAAIADPTARAVVVTNEGTTFCAGADLKGARAGRHGQSAVGLTDVFPRILDSPKPMVARVAGHCMGGGVGLAAAFDISIVAESARFGFTEARIGVAPAVISVVCLPKMRRADASELFLRGSRFPASRAAEVGLVTRAVPDGRLDDEVAAVTDDLVRGGPAALEACKRLINEVPRADRDEALAWTAELSASLFASDEAAEGIAAFLERRDAAWVPDP